MSEQLRESLSAVMDDEADAFELRRVLDEAKVDADLREQWYRFHLARDVLKSEAGQHHPELRARIWAALNEPADDEEEVAELVLAETGANPASGRSPWLTRITGAAVAATVAAVVVLYGGVFDEAPVEPAVVAQTAVSGPAVPVLVPVMHQQVHAADRERTNGLLLHHIQHKAINTPGVQSFVKLATFSDARPLALPQGGSGDQPSP